MMTLHPMLSHSVLTLVILEIPGPDLRGSSLHWGHCVKMGR